MYCDGQVALTAGGMLGFSYLLGPRRRKPGKLDPYECGMPLLDSARKTISVKFYLVAILFVLFDVEAVFLIPWAVTYAELYPVIGFVLLGEMLVFLAVLVLGLLYVWRRGGLEWE